MEVKIFNFNVFEVRHLFLLLGGSSMPRETWSAGQVALPHLQEGKVEEDFFCKKISTGVFTVLCVCRTCPFKLYHNLRLFLRFFPECRPFPVRPQGPVNSFLRKQFLPSRRLPGHLFTRANMRGHRHHRPQNQGMIQVKPNAFPLLIFLLTLRTD